MEEAGKGDPSSEKIPPGPDLLVWLCTSRCNLNCRHCYVNYRFQGELNTEEALNFIEEVARLRPNFFSITGGEPLLRKDLFQILEKARGLDLACDIITNGLLLNKELVAELKVFVFLSLDGASRESCEAMRGESDDHNFSKCP